VQLLLETETAGNALSAKRCNDLNVALDVLKRRLSTAEEDMSLMSSKYSQCELARADLDARNGSAEIEAWHSLLRFISPRIDVPLHLL
jgi:hypothetical protein